MIRTIIATVLVLVYKSFCNTLCIYGHQGANKSIVVFTSTYLNTWVERGTVRVKCAVQEHNIMSPARARTRIARSRSTMRSTRLHTST